MGKVNRPGRPGILACGSQRRSLAFPRRRVPETRDAVAYRLEPAPWRNAPRLQWRHRVGFAPTSRDRSGVAQTRPAAPAKAASAHEAAIILERYAGQGGGRRARRHRAQARCRHAPLLRRRRPAVRVPRHACARLARQPGAREAARLAHLLQLQHAPRSHERLRRELSVLLVRAPATRRSGCRPFTT